MNILIINGPNLNLLGKREPEIYGNLSFEEYFEELKSQFPMVNLSYYQSNCEGKIIDAIHSAGYDGKTNAIVLNAGAYSHYSIAIADAIAAIPIPVAEVHISNIFSREEKRHKSVLSGVCCGFVCGFGLKGYELAINAIIQQGKE